MERQNQKEDGESEQYREKDRKSEKYDEDDVEITKETILENLEELRRRIILPLAVFLIVFVVSLPFSKYLLQLFVAPFRDITSDFIFTKPFEAFWVHVKLSAYVGVFVAIPFFIWQMWLFVSPALYPHERKLARIIVFGVIVLFSSGTLFGYFFVLPVSLKFLIKTFSSEFIQPFLSISEFFSFAVKFSIAFGFAFQTPVIILSLEKLGFVDREKLKRSRPYAIVGAFIISAIITPTPDALTQTLLAIPLIILWEFGILLTKVI